MGARVISIAFIGVRELSDGLFIGCKSIVSDITANTHIPGVAPLPAVVVVYIAADTQCEVLEPPEVEDHSAGPDDEADELSPLREAWVCEEPKVKDVAGHEDGEPESRQVVVEIRDTAHDKERNVVKEPAEEGNFGNVEPVVPLSRSPLLVVALLTKNVPGANDQEEKHRDGREVPNDGSTEEVELDHVVAPATHAETETQEWPVERLGSENVLLVGVGDQGIVGGPHGDVQM